MNCAVDTTCNLKQFDDQFRLAFVKSCPHTVLLSPDTSGFKHLRAVAAALTPCGRGQLFCNGGTCFKESRPIITVSAERDAEERDCRLWTLWIRCVGVAKSEVLPNEVEVPLPPFYAKGFEPEPDTRVFSISRAEGSSTATIGITCELRVQDDKTVKTLWDSYKYVHVVA